MPQNQTKPNFFSLSLSLSFFLSFFLFSFRFLLFLLYYVAIVLEGLWLEVLKKNIKVSMNKKDNSWNLIQKREHAMV